MAALTFSAARAVVLDYFKSYVGAQAETVTLGAADGRVLAEPVIADRDYPAAARSIRDGFAVRAGDVPGTVRIIGEVRAGGRFTGTVGAGEGVEIMTGAPMPAGADAVVMVEHTTRDGDRMSTERASRTGEFVNPQGAEARRGDTVLSAGARLAFPQVALLATYGYTEVQVYRQPRVAILSTGDEVIPVAETPADNQVRNSNAWALAAQVRRAGGIPTILPVAPDEPAATRALMEEGLTHDMLLLSGGVSAGKYDYVEPVLADLGARFFFDRVLIQPGQPLVFGQAMKKPFFGLPGNPASTMVCFHVFARAAVERLSGREASLGMPRLRLTRDFRHKTGLTRFLPARTNDEMTEVTPVNWQGSSDVAALARGNAFLVADAETPEYPAGSEIPVILYE